MLIQLSLASFTFFSNACDYSVTSKYLQILQETLTLQFHFNFLYYHLSICCQISTAVSKKTAFLSQRCFPPFFGQGTSYNNCLVNSDQNLEKQLVDKSTRQHVLNSKRSVFFLNTVKVPSSHSSSLEGSETKYSCHLLCWRHSHTFGSSFFTMLSHTFLRRALSCSMDKCFFLVPGGGAS